MLLGKATAPENTRLYAIGDIHGCLDQLIRLFAMIDDDLEANPVPSHQIIALGDFVDRGPDSRGVLTFLAENVKSRPLICLRGNHDQRMLDFLDVPESQGESFLLYGGLDLLRSYGIDADTGSDITTLSKELKRAVPRSHIAFLGGLRMSHEAGDYFFCHAGIQPGVSLEDQQARDLMWIREPFLVHQKAHPKVIVHGHTPSDDVDIQPNRINLDSGCFHTGILSCVALEGTSHRLLQVAAE